MAFEFTRARVIESLRVHHTLFTLSALYYGGANSSWHGTDSYSNGGGDRFDVAWDASALVGLVFDHESDRAQSELHEDERSSLRWLPGITGSAKALALGTAPGLENNVTAGVWTNDLILVLSDPLTALGPAAEFAQLAGLFLPPAEAVFGQALCQNWLELSSVSEAHARVALRLAGGRATTVTAAEQEVLLQVPAGCGPIQIAAAEAVAEALGLAWASRPGAAADLSRRRRSVRASTAHCHVRVPARFRAVRDRRATARALKVRFRSSMMVKCGRPPLGPPRRRLPALARGASYPQIVALVSPDPYAFDARVYEAEGGYRIDVGSVHVP